MSRTFLPVIRMLERAELARDESDTSYYFELLYLGELVIKFLVIEVLASIEQEREQYRHALEYRLVRANGIGEWADALDEGSYWTAESASHPGWKGITAGHHPKP